MLKFRTMHADAAGRQDELEASNDISILIKTIPAVLSGQGA